LIFSNFDEILQHENESKLYQDIKKLSNIEYIKVIILTHREANIEMKGQCGHMKSLIKQVVLGNLEKKYQAKLMHEIIEKKKTSKI
jgi:hypothetical protein